MTYAVNGTFQRTVRLLDMYFFESKVYLKSIGKNKKHILNVFSMLF